MPTRGVGEFPDLSAASWNWSHANHSMLSRHRALLHCIYPFSTNAIPSNLPPPTREKIKKKNLCIPQYAVDVSSGRRSAAISFVPMNPIPNMPTQAAVDSDAGTTCVGTLDEKKAKQRAYAAKWRANNRDKERARGAKYYKDNRDKEKARNADYYARNKDKVKAKCAKYCANNKDKVRAVNAAYESKPEIRARRRVQAVKWYAANSEKERARFAKYCASSRDKVLATHVKHYAKYRDKINARKAKRRATPHGRAKAVMWSHARRARKRSATVGDPKVIAAWFQRRRMAETTKCYWCRATVEGKLAHMDHIHPLARGGSHSIGNLCVSCPSCNARKNAKDLAEWNKTLLEPVLF